MNLKRGLLRLWLAASLLWVSAVGVVGWPEISHDWLEASRFHRSAGAVPLVPVSCGEVRGEAGKDYTTKEGQNPGPWDVLAKPNPFDNCWYEMSALRNLWPEYKDMSDDTLSAKLYEAVGATRKPVSSAGSGMVALLAVVPPFMLLLLGAMTVWIAAGFRKSPV